MSGNNGSGPIPTDAEKAKMNKMMTLVKEVLPTRAAEQFVHEVLTTKALIDSHASFEAVLMSFTFGYTMAVQHCNEFGPGVIGDELFKVNGGE